MNIPLFTLFLVDYMCTNLTIVRIIGHFLFSILEIFFEELVVNEKP